MIRYLGGGWEPEAGGRRFDSQVASSLISGELQRRQFVCLLPERGAVEGRRLGPCSGRSHLVPARISERDRGTSGIAVNRQWRVPLGSARRTWIFSHLPFREVIRISSRSTPVLAVRIEDKRRLLLWSLCVGGDRGRVAGVCLASLFQFFLRKF